MNADTAKRKADIALDLVIWNLWQKANMDIQFKEFRKVFLITKKHLEKELTEEKISPILCGKGIILK